MSLPSVCYGCIRLSLLYSCIRSFNDGGEGRVAFDHFRTKALNRK